jgi:hypothetical protein
MPIRTTWQNKSLKNLFATPEPHYTKHGFNDPWEVMFHKTISKMAGVTKIYDKKIQFCTNAWHMVYNQFNFQLDKQLHIEYNRYKLVGTSYSILNQSIVWLPSCEIQWWLTWYIYLTDSFIMCPMFFSLIKFNKLSLF